MFISQKAIARIEAKSNLALKIPRESNKQVTTAAQRVSCSGLIMYLSQDPGSMVVNISYLEPWNLLYIRKEIISNKVYCSRYHHTSSPQEMQRRNIVLCIRGPSNIYSKRERKNHPTGQRCQHLLRKWNPLRNEQ